MINFEEFREYINLYKETFITNFKSDINFNEVFDIIKKDNTEYLKDIDNSINFICEKYLENI